jgi:hypothetical protein
MKNDAFKPAGGASRPLHAGPTLQGANLGEHFRMQASPQMAQPMGPRSIKDGGGRFQPAVESARLGQAIATAPLGAEGRAVAPERQQQNTKFRPESQAQGIRLAGNSGVGTPPAPAPAPAPRPAQATSAILVTVEAIGPDNVTYAAPHIVDFPLGSKVLGVKYEPYTGE